MIKVTIYWTDDHGWEALVTAPGSCREYAYRSFGIMEVVELASRGRELTWKVRGKKLLGECKV